MNIHFNRRELQVACETIARNQQGLAADSAEFRFKGALEVTSSDLTLLKECQLHDTISFYYNSLYSFLQALKSFKAKSYSWATVQFYYSVFYSCKAILGFDNIGIIRKNGLHKIELKIGEKAKGFKQDNDHKQTIKCYTSSYANSFILSNNIGGQTFFEWIQDAREITNYRQQVFLEPRTLNFWESIVRRIKDGATIDQILDLYSSNWALYCFQEDSAIIAGPYRLLSEVFQKYENQTEKLSVPEKKEILALAKELKLTTLNCKIFDVPSGNN